MSWMARLRWQVNDRQLENLVLEITARCRQAILKRASGSIHAMSQPELRGYVRARSAAVVPIHTNNVVVEEGLPREMAQWLESLATEEVVRQLASDLQRQSASRTARLRAA